MCAVGKGRVSVDGEMNKDFDLQGSVLIPKSHNVKVGDKPL